MTYDTLMIPTRRKIHDTARVPAQGMQRGPNLTGLAVHRSSVIEPITTKLVRLRSERLPPAKFLRHSFARTVLNTNRRDPTPRQLRTPQIVPPTKHD